MVEFMKEKYTEETTKMKEHCETYQKEVYVEFIESMNNSGQTNADLSHKLWAGVWGLISAPPIPVGFQSFQWNPVE